MRRIVLLAAIGVLCLGTTVPAANVLAQQKPAPVRVHEVSAVRIGFVKTLPPNALVSATGTVLTGGFTNPRLVKVIYVVPPTDGIQELRFIIDPPKGSIVTQSIVEVTTPELDIGRVPKWMKGVRVEAATNKIEKLLNGS